ncbi:MAG: hypothetical protein GX437_08390 [Sphingobacteriales bacterium]|nr:hypothetical protein [Sphingobacteriales bacterium]
MYNPVKAGKNPVNRIIRQLKLLEFQYSTKFRNIGLLLILLICCILYLSGPSLKKKQVRLYTTGFSYQMAMHFLYFYYYTGNFPLATLDTLTPSDYSKEGAKRLIQTRGQNLIMEYRHWSRMGENARIFAFLPDALVEGPENPKLKLFNSLVFIASLMIFFIGFYRNGKGLPGLLIVFIVMLTPFYQYAVFREKNIFALLGSVFLLISGLNASFIFGKNLKKSGFLVPLASGIIIAFFTEIRGEILVVIFSAFLIYLTSKSLRIYHKILLISILSVSFFSMRMLVRNYFDKKFDKTTQLVIEKGGHPYNGKRASAHSFWHPVFCGLGDFDTKYGYRWEDTVAYHYALPLLRLKTGINYKYSGKYHLDAYYDQDSLYYVKFEEIPEYEPIVKEKVLSDIRHDPFWYLGILLKRILRIFSNSLPFRYCGWLLFPVMVWLFRKKEFQLGWFLIASFPLSVTPLLIYSGGNSTFNSIFPIIALAILLYFIIENMFLQKIDTVR